MGHTQYTSLKWAVAVPGIAAKSYSGLVSGQAKLIKLIPLASGKVECDTNPASPNVDKLDKGRGSRGRYLEAAWLIGWPDGNEHDSKVDRPFMGALTLTCLPVPVGADPVPLSVA